MNSLQNLKVRELHRLANLLSENGYEVRSIAGRFPPGRFETEILLSLGPDIGAKPIRTHHSRKPAEPLAQTSVECLVRFLTLLVPQGYTITQLRGRPNRNGGLDLQIEASTDRIFEGGGTAGGEPVTNPRGPNLLTPVKGEWNAVKEMIDGVLGAEQVPYFHAWMQKACEALYKGEPEEMRPGQFCIFAGPAGSGKSLLQRRVITALLGGRSSDPGCYLFGRAKSDSEMFNAEHLCVEDPIITSSAKARACFGEMIKGIVVNDTPRERSRRETLTGTPFWRLTISLSDDPHTLRTLPVMTPDLIDKVMIFRTAKRGAWMKLQSEPGEWSNFLDQVAAELPAYLHYLLEEHEIPAHLISQRFGIKAYCNPEIAIEQEGKETEA